MRARIRSRRARAAAPPFGPEAELASQFGVSRGTVRQALASLRGEGLIVGGQGRRTVVAKPLLAQSFDELVSFTSWAENLGLTPTARTLDLTRRPADARDALDLELEEGTQIFQYRRLRLLDGEPAMIEVSSFVEPVGRLLLDCDLNTGSVYTQLGAMGIVFHEAQQKGIAAIAANAGTIGAGRGHGVPEPPAGLGGAQNRAWVPTEARVGGITRYHTAVMSSRSRSKTARRRRKRARELSLHEGAGPLQH